MTNGMMVKYLSGDEYRMNCRRESDQVYDGDESVEVL